MLSTEEKKRYDRHIILPEFGEEAQQKLKDAKVLVVGAGGLGCPVLLYLTAAGVGTIGIIDGDIVDESNLQRQVLFDTNDIGLNKASTAAEKLKLQNPFVEFVTYIENLSEKNALSIFEVYDVIVDGSDNFATRYLCNDAALISDKPLVHGSIFKFEGQVSVFNYQNGPTYRCLFPEPPAAGSVPSCSEIGVLGVLPGIIGNYQALETIKLITGIGDVLSGKLLCINTLSNSQQVLEFDKNLDTATVSELLDNYSYFCGVCDLVTEINYTKAKELMASKKFQLIDVREPVEYKAHNIGGENRPLSSFKAKDRDTTLIPIFLCAKGQRSKKAAQLFSNANNQLAYSIVGGINNI